MTREGREMVRERDWMKRMDLSESVKRGIGEQGDRGCNAGTREGSLLHRADSRVKRSTTGIPERDGLEHAWDQRRVGLEKNGKRQEKARGQKNWARDMSNRAIQIRKMWGR